MPVGSEDVEVLQYNLALRVHETGHFAGNLRHFRRGP